MSGHYIAKCSKLLIQLKLASCEFSSLSIYTVKPVLSGHSKRRPKIGFQDRLPLNAGQKYCRMLHESILQYFRPSLSYHLSLRPLFCPFLTGRLGQVLLYVIGVPTASNQDLFYSPEYQLNASTGNLLIAYLVGEYWF